MMWPLGTQLIKQTRGECVDRLGWGPEPYPGACLHPLVALTGTNPLQSPMQPTGLYMTVLGACPDPLDIRWNWSVAVLGYPVAFCCLMVRGMAGG